MNILKAIARAAYSAFFLIATVGCSKNDIYEPTYPYPRQQLKRVCSSFDNRKVLLFYECGFNNLSSYLKDNMDGREKGLPAGYVPPKSGDVILIYSKHPKSGTGYGPSESHLRRLYKKLDGEIVSDTLRTFGTDVVASSSSTMREILNFVKDEYPAKGYGMVFSSHGSGWLPAGYYASPSRFEADPDRQISSGMSALARQAQPEDRMERLPVPAGDISETDPYYGLTRSLGQDIIRSDLYYGHEMSVSEFADGIPFHLDYILFDMCFTAGVEVAYGLKDKADYLGLSPAEVLGDGMFDYTKLTSFLINRQNPDLEGLFKDSFNMYDRQDGVYRSSTVNVIRTEGLDNLASVCGKLIKEYSDTLAKAPASDIQGYFRQGRHYFYDLVDIFSKCGASQEELAMLNDAVNRCVVYKNATEYFMNDFKITSYSGFSMYLPCAGTPLLDSYYKKEAWNKATGFVQ